MLYIKAMKKWREAIGNAIDTGVWSVEIGRSTSKERDILAVTVDNACTIHCAKQSHVVRHFSYYFFQQMYVFGDWHHREKA